MRAEQELELRAAGDVDWRDWRELRLEALQDTPIAFCETYDEALRKSEQSWQERVTRGHPVLLRTDGRPVAMALGYRDDATGEPWLGAVYVTPRHRGRGLLDSLVAEVARWAAAQGAARLPLLVHETNAAAQAAYRRLGFVETGRSEPYPLDPGTRELEMVLALTTSASVRPFGAVEAVSPGQKPENPAIS